MLGCGGAYVIGGFNGHGFQHSRTPGRVLADHIAGCDSGLDLLPFACDRFTARTRTAERHVV